MDVRTLILLAISCLMLILLVTALVRPVARPSRAKIRVVTEPEGEQWLDLAALAQRLETRPAEIVALVERDAIPFWVRPARGRGDPQTYWFRSDEIEAWTIG